MVAMRDGIRDEVLSAFQAVKEAEEAALRAVAFEDTGEVVAAPRAVVGGTQVDEKAAGDSGHCRVRRKPRADKRSGLSGWNQRLLGEMNRIEISLRG